MPQTNSALGISTDKGASSILLYVRDRDTWRKTRNLLPRTEHQLSRYRNPDNDPRGDWLQGDNGTAKSGTEKQRFKVTLPSGRVVTPPPGRYWVFSEESLERARREGRAYFGSDGDGLPIIKRYLSEVQQGVVPRTFWTADEAGHNQEAKRDHLNKLLQGITPFETPKPERLLQRILTIATDPGEWVLDSFLGSGTTAATAHKMNRKWIGIELGDHCNTHCIPRLKKVCDGTDQGGISEAQNWKGGGGFKYYYLAPSLLLQDKKGNWIINKQYNAAQLAAAMAKHEGFRFQPDETYYWKQGQSTEKDYIFTTTNFVSVDLVDTIQSEMKSDESLLICCTSFSKAADKYPNITIKKIPKMLLGRCEFGKEDYSLNIVNMPREDDEPDFVPTGPIATNPSKSRKGPVDKQEDLFSSAKGGKK